MTAIKSLKKSERDAVLAGIGDDRTLGKDLLDLAVFAEREEETARPFNDYEEERLGICQSVSTDFP